MEALAPHRALGQRRNPGDVYECPPDTAKHLSKYGYVRIRPWDFSWHSIEGREFRLPAPDVVERPVVACLNIWNDTPALEETAPRWWPHVDAVVIADGAYRDVGGAGSTDGLKHYVGTLAAEHETRVKWVPRPKGGWNQPEKRTALLRYASKHFPAARLLIVDADEMLSGVETLKSLPDMEVGWATVTSSLYEREQGQPRVILASDALRYEGRHHWLYRGDEPLATHQYGGTGIRHGLTKLRIHNARGLKHSPERRLAKTRHLMIQRNQEAGTGDARDQGGARETLRILQLGRADAGLVAYRLHTALNTTTPHASALVIGQDRNPFGGPRQFGWPDDRGTVEAMAEMADVLHSHLFWRPLTEMKAPMTGWRVIHHHGTMYRGTVDDRGNRTRPALWALWDLKERAVLRLVSNTELLQYDPDLQFLPNPMPVGWYQAVRRTSEVGPGFRVAHSPSKRSNKGTDVFLRACERAKVEPVLVEKRPHADSIRIKATCHAAFDSFWLGIQCSGLEAAAMGLPVIAGDVDCKREYQGWLGEVPYTWANDENELVEALERLKNDAEFYRTESERVHRYTVDHHDDAAVARRYLDLLDDRVKWRQALRLNQKPIKHTPPNPVSLVRPHPLRVPPPMVARVLPAEPIPA